MQEILRKFAKIFKIILKKIAKMQYFSTFFTKFNKPCVKCLRVWTKNAICRSFLRKFSKVFYRKWQNCIILTSFSKNASWGILSKFWKPWLKFNGKIEFFNFYFGKFLSKIEPSKITPFSYNFFGFVGISGIPPGYAPACTPIGG